MRILQPLQLDPSLRLRALLAEAGLVLVLWLLDGLVGGHAYSILDCKELADVMLGEQKKLSEYFVTDSRAIVETDRLEALRREQTLLSEDGTLRVIRLRNPWGRREWQVL
jgi:hypothetical protein